MESIMFANEEPEAPTTPGIQVGYLGQLVEVGIASVAEIDGYPVGFACALDTGRSRHLADLFVRPANHGQGIGRRLLDEVMGQAWPRTTFASGDPRALPIYIRAGMAALWPNLYLEGRPAAIPRPATDHVIVDASFETMAELERRWTGVDRRPLLAYWSELREPRPFVVRMGAKVVATGFTRRRMAATAAHIDHLIVAPGEDPLPPLILAFREGRPEAEQLGGCVPGPSPVVRVLLDAGFRIPVRDTYLASDPGLVDPEREVMNTGFL